MFCYQCEQTAMGTGCNRAMGVCGKTAETADLQDMLFHVLKGLSQYAAKLNAGPDKKAFAKFVLEGLFTTVTNVNFDAIAIRKMIDKAIEMREKAKAMSGGQELGGPAAWRPGSSEDISITARQEEFGEDAAGLQELITYGLKGTAAYADHALILGVEDEEVNQYFLDTMAKLAENLSDIDELLGMALKAGEINLKVMGMLDQANTSAYGNPEPTQVRITPKAGKAILVSGHDLKDLEELLKQTEGTGINVYTHSEMLPANAYPGLKKYPHLAGNYGGAWQDQRKEFAEFPGAVLMTTNCIQKPAEEYQGRIFTTGLVGWPGVTHVKGPDFFPVIEAAKAAPGFAGDGEDKTITIGFGHDAVMQVAGTVVEAVKSGAVKHFFLIGGCDGAKPGRNYYTEFAEKVPRDCVILTLACGKYRFNKLEFGDIGGIPRLLDCGQCNDAYSAVQIALALMKAFDCGLNDLPLSMVLSWFEQKAVAILLTLLYLGKTDIRLGPSLPAFVTPTVLNVLVDKFKISPISDPDTDLKAILGK